MSDSLHTRYRETLVRVLVRSGVANKVFDQSFWYSQCRLEARSHRVPLVISELCQRKSQADMNDAIFPNRKLKKRAEL